MNNTNPAFGIYNSEDIGCFPYRPPKYGMSKEVAKFFKNDLLGGGSWCEECLKYGVYTWVDSFEKIIHAIISAMSDDTTMKKDCLFCRKRKMGGRAYLDKKCDNR